MVNPKNEKEFQTIFGKWFVRNKSLFKSGCIAFECKYTKTDSLPFSAVKPHQERSLKQAETGLWWKLPDVGLMAKPFDCIYLEGAQHYIPVYFQKSKSFYIIDIFEWLLYKEQTIKKSISETECSEIAFLEVKEWKDILMNT